MNFFHLAAWAGASLFTLVTWILGVRFMWRTRNEPRRDWNARLNWVINVVLPPISLALLLSLLWDALHN